MNLKQHITEHHNGNISAFARTQGVRQDQVARWLNRGCIVENGVVYCPVVEQPKSKLEVNHD